MNRTTVRRAGAGLAAVLVLLGLTSCASVGARRAGHGQVAGSVQGMGPAPASYGRPPTISLGNGLYHFPDQAMAWVAANPNDSRTPLIKQRIASQPTALWLTGNSSFGNLQTASTQAAAQNRTMVLTIYNIPLRWDGLSTPSAITLGQYKSWLQTVAGMIGNTRAIITLEPDALWFYDRLPTSADQRTRLTALRYALSTFAAKAPRTRVYLDAGTSSGSVTPARMADLLMMAGVTGAAGYAVNVSSYSPAASIQRYAQLIKNALVARGLTNPRYVIDTGRNGASSWNTNWCNPTTQRLGAPPALVQGGHGLDLDLWIKGPGTSDGDCGPPGRGAGSYGGQFLPAVAYKMITG